MNVDFDVLIDSTFVELYGGSELSPVANKSVLSLINDFEDGKWRYSKFHSFIWDNIAETSLSQKERACLVNKPHTLLVDAAKNLRLTDKENDKSQGSELAEIALYGIMKHHYSALSVVPKIFYKQNPQDNAKGADSVHIVIEGKTDFSLWFGEAKFYNSIEDARLSSIVESVRNSLKTDKLKKENSIITSVSDLDTLITDDKLKERIKQALSNRKSIDDLKPKLHVPIFILHKCDITNQANRLTDEYKGKIIEYHKDRAKAYFEKQIKKLASIDKYADIGFHIILFPVPQKKVIIDEFVKKVEQYKE